MEHQTCTYEQPRMDVIVTDGGVPTDDFGINIAASVIEDNPRYGSCRIRQGRHVLQHPHQLDGSRFQHR